MALFVKLKARERIFINGALCVMGRSAEFRILHEPGEKTNFAPPGHDPVYSSLEGKRLANDPERMKDDHTRS